MSRHHRSQSAPSRRQRGAALVFIVIGLTALLLAAALALDVGHATLNESRLQNAVDAAALAAAKILDDTKSTTLATTEAFTAFGNNANSTGDQELASAYANGNGSISITVQYSATLPPFTVGSPVGPYVRVIASGFRRPTWFATLAGISQVSLSASAVAGPSPSIYQSCNLVPMMVCGNAAAGAAANWGYTVNAPTVMKLAAPGGGTVGPGNFQLIQLGGSGANVVRQNLAGGYNGCLTLGNSITTQPGNETGPVADGLDTRFGDYSGSMGGDQSIYPPDVITTQPSPALTVNTSASGCSDSSPCIQQGSNGPIVTASNINSLSPPIFTYQTYQSELANPADYTYQPIPAGIGEFNRRVMSVAVGNCSGGSGGSSSIPILGFACFFLLQEPTHSGNTDWVLGQFIGNCNTDGTPGPSPSSGPQPYIIQLYRDPNSGNS
jgi:Flp pilus assembly protein TadG